MANDIFSKTLTRSIQAGTAGPLQEQSKTWLKDLSKKVEDAHLTSRIEVGKMYFFTYNPKTKDDLPYYDQLPLIFPFAKSAKGFYGINLHYLPYMYRAKLMDALYDLANSDTLDANTKLVLSYKILNTSSRLRYFKPCVKQYLNNHVSSRFMAIHGNEWSKALFLPLEQFAKASKERVFQESIKKIRK